MNKIKRQWEENKNIKQSKKKQTPRENGIKNIIKKTKKALTKKQKKDTTQRRWNNEEIEFLKNNFKHKTDKQIGNSLNRNERSVINKRINLNLKKRSNILLEK